MLREVVKKALTLAQSKQNAELAFWRKEIKRYQDWFSGDLSSLYKTPSPNNEQKVKGYSLKDASILTWHKLHQEVKYLEDIDLTPRAFQGLKVLDIGSGPMPSGTCFEGCQLYCLDPLLAKYLEAGFPLHYYGNVNFIHGPSEQIPVEDNFFDAVISVNAIDHVDDIQKTASEIKRVLKSGGMLRMHVHYHPPSICEPINFNDDFVAELFNWCVGLKKVKSMERSHSTDLPDNEKFVLWSSF